MVRQKTPKVTVKDSNGKIISSKILQGDIS